jgi:hypothetical protein
MKHNEQSANGWGFSKSWHHFTHVDHSKKGREKQERIAKRHHDHAKQHDHDDHEPDILSPKHGKSAEQRASEAAARAEAARKAAEAKARAEAAKAKAAKAAKIKKEQEVKIAVAEKKAKVLKLAEKKEAVREVKLEAKHKKSKATRTVLTDPFGLQTTPKTAVAKLGGVF